MQILSFVNMESGFSVFIENRASDTKALTLLIFVNFVNPNELMNKFGLTLVGYSIVIKIKGKSHQNQTNIFCLW